MSTLLSLSIAILAGLLMTRVFKPLKLPAVTAYLVAGVLIGPYCLGRLGIDGLGFTSYENVEHLSLVSEVALGFIAFSIGSEFRVSSLKHTGKQAAVIGVLQALTATLLVDIALIAIATLSDALSVAQAITLGAIATATAPAATLMVVRQYKAKGPLVDLLLPIVALDDAVGLVVFAVSFGIAKAMNVGAFDLVSILANPLLEIVCSLLLGAVMGWLLTQLEKLFNSNTNRLNMTISFVFLTAALAMQEFEIGPVKIGFSSLLVCMMLGTVFCNLCPLSEEIMAKADRGVLRHLRRRAGAFGVCRQDDRPDRPRLHRDAFARQISRRALQREADEVQPCDLQIPRHHAAAAGGRGAWHVRHGQRAWPRGRPDPQHHALCHPRL